MKSLICKYQIYINLGEIKFNIIIFPDSMHLKNVSNKISVQNEMLFEIEFFLNVHLIWSSEF